MYSNSAHWSYLEQLVKGCSSHTIPARQQLRLGSLASNWRSKDKRPERARLYCKLRQPFLKYCWSNNLLQGNSNCFTEIVGGRTVPCMFHLPLTLIVSAPQVSRM